MNPYKVNQTLNLDIRNAPGQECLYMFGKKILTQDCNENYPCGICKLPENQLIYMKGLCKDDRNNLYDVQYYAHGVINDRPYFRWDITNSSYVFTNLFHYKHTRLQKVDK